MEESTRMIQYIMKICDDSVAAFLSDEQRINFRIRGTGYSETGHSISVELKVEGKIS